MSNLVTITGVTNADKDGCTVTGECAAQEYVRLVFSRSSGDFSATNTYAVEITNPANGTVLAGNAATPVGQEYTNCVYSAGSVSATLDLSATPMRSFMNSAGNPMTRTARLYMFDATERSLWVAKEITVWDNGYDAAATLTALDDWD